MSSNHGTTSILFPDWYIRFQQAALAALPRPPELDQNTGLGWADDGETMKRVLAEALLPKQDEIASVSVSTPSLKPTYPAIGEVFELTLDGVLENEPIEMVRRDGYNPEGWKHTGKRVSGKQTRRFTLVSVSYSRTFDDLTRKLDEHGAIPEGQWREALKAAYQHDGKGPVGIADSSWVFPDGGAYFPCVYASGHSDFRWAGRGFDDGWRWLVEASK